jgi:hypothetical protein
MVGVDGQALHQCLANEALDEARAATQTGQYSRWRKQVDAGWLLKEHVLPCVVLVINDNPYGLMFASSYICRTCP